MTYHATNKNNKEIIIASIPWNLATYINHFQAGDCISKRVSENNTTLAWVYHVTKVMPNTVQAIEFQRVTPIGLIKAANSMCFDFDKNLINFMQFERTLMVDHR